MRNLLVAIAAAILIAPSVAAVDWPMFRYDETHQGTDGANTEFTIFTQQWWNNRSIPATVKGSPVVKDGRAFIGAWDNNLYALDSESGSLLWKNITGGKITGSPAVSENIVYVATESGTLYAFNARTGQKEREVSVGSGTFGSPVVHERRVFIGTGTADAGGKVVAYEGDTLTKIWEFPVASQSGPGGKYFNVTVPDGQVEVSPAIYNGQVLFGASNQYFYSVSEQGIGGGKTTLTWMFKAGGSIRSSPAVDKANSRVLFGAQDGKLYSVNLAVEGYIESAVWTLAETAGAGLPSQIQSSPAISGDKAFVGVNNGNVIAVNLADGSRVWARATGGQVVSSPAVANGFILVGSSDRNMYMLNRSDGGIAWQRTASSTISSSPAIVGTQGFWAGEDGSLYSWGGTKPQRPDLKVASISASLVSGQAGQVSINIQNVGQLPAPLTEAQLFNGAALVGSSAVPAVNAGEGTSITFSFVPPGAQTYTFRVVVDPTNAIREVDESNNVLIQPITASNPPPPATAESSEEGAPGFEVVGILGALAAAILIAGRRKK